MVLLHTTSKQQEVKVTFSEVRVDAHVTRRAGQAFVFPIRYVFVRLQVYVLFGQSEIYDVNNLFPFGRGSAYQEVFRFDIAVDQMPTMNVFYPMELSKEEQRFSDWRSFGGHKCFIID